MFFLHMNKIISTREWEKKNDRKRKRLRLKGAIKTQQQQILPQTFVNCGCFLILSLSHSNLLYIHNLSIFMVTSTEICQKEKKYTKNNLVLDTQFVVFLVTTNETIKQTNRSVEQYNLKTILLRAFRCVENMFVESWNLCLCTVCTRVHPKKQTVMLFLQFAITSKTATATNIETIVHGWITRIGNIRYIHTHRDTHFCAHKYTIRHVHTFEYTWTHAHKKNNRTFQNRTESSKKKSRTLGLIDTHFNSFNIRQFLCQCCLHISSFCFSSFFFLSLLRFCQKFNKTSVNCYFAERNNWPFF